MQRPRPRAGITLAGAALTYSERIVISLPVYISTLLSDRLLVRRLRYALLGGTPKRDERYLSLGKALAGVARTLRDRRSNRFLTCRQPRFRQGHEKAFPMIRKGVRGVDGGRNRGVRRRLPSPLPCGLKPATVRDMNRCRAPRVS
jgi:hypothetical protein